MTRRERLLRELQCQLGNIKHGYHTVTFTKLQGDDLLAELAPPCESVNGYMEQGDAMGTPGPWSPCTEHELAILNASNDVRKAKAEYEAAQLKVVALGKELHAAWDTAAAAGDRVNAANAALEKAVHGGQG